MKERGKKNFLRRHSTEIIVSVTVISSVVLYFMLSGKELEFGYTLEELENEFSNRVSKIKRGRPGTPTVLYLPHEFESRRAAAKFVGGSDPGISLAYSRGQDTYLDNKLG